MEQLKDFLNKHNIQYECAVSLKCKTWIKTGGNASFWITPTSIYELTVLCKYLYNEGLRFEIVGYTSNLFFLSDYNPDIVVSTIKLTGYQIKNNLVVCDCGVRTAILSRECAENNYIGYYGLVDLPGTIAAAVYNNAGCFQCSVSSLLESINLLTPQGEVITLTPNALNFEHRTSALKQKKYVGVIIQVILKVELSSENEAVKAAKVHDRRKIEQEPAARNLGSIYSRLGNRQVNVENMFIRVVNKIKKLSPKQRKSITLFLYGYRHLTKYISNKNLNTFMWKDAQAENLFKEYNRLMHKIYKNITMEIEIKDGK